jgi:uncharacterized C2H2 Zn-finger protein
MDILEKDREFLFRCNTCEMIVSVKFESSEEIEKVQENKTILECSCGGHCLILRD